MEGTDIERAVSLEEVLLLQLPSGGHTLCHTGEAPKPEGGPQGGSLTQRFHSL